MDKSWDNFRISIILFLLGIAVLIASVSIIASRINSQLREQFKYETARDLCYEDALAHHTYCHVERQASGKFNWYYIEGEQEGDN